MTSDVNEWLALLRVHEGRVIRLDGHYLNHGRAVADYLADALDELVRTELLALARPDPIGAQQVCVTHAGQIRYAELNSNGVREAHGGDRRAQRTEHGAHLGDDVSPTTTRSLDEERWGENVTQH